MKENNKMLTILGAFIGALVGTIPLAFVYNFGNILIAIMSLPISIFSYYGYMIMKGKLNKKLSATIIISCIVAVTMSTFIFVPTVNLLAKGYKASFENLSMFYGIAEIKEEFIKDYVISLFFMLFGGSGVVLYISKQLKENNDTEKNAKNDGNNLESKQGDNTEKESNNEDKSKNDVDKYRNKKIIIAILLIIFVILVAVGSTAVQNNNNKQSDEGSKEKKSENILEEIEVETNEIEHKIPGTGLKFVPKDDLRILTKKQIESYFGTNASNYELIAMDDTGTRMLYMFIDDGEDAKGLSETEYLRHTFSDDENIEITEISISGMNFEKTRRKT